MTVRSTCLVFFPLALYILTLNPYINPAVADNLAYYESALALVESGRYEFDGVLIDNWPPGFPFLLTLPFFIGLKSVLAAKIVVLATAGFGMIFTYLLLRREGFRYPALVSMFAWMLPQMLYSGTCIMSDVPSLTFSLVFLFLLNRQRNDRRDLPFAMFAGFFLGWTALTRWFGVLLGVAVIAQALMQLRSRRGEPLWKRCLPEVSTGLVGGAMFMAWCQFFIGGLGNLPFLFHDSQWSVPYSELPAKQPEEWMQAWLQWDPENLEEPQESPGGNQFEIAEGFYDQPRLVRVPDLVSDVMFEKEALLRLAGLPRYHPVRFLFVIPLLVLGVGLVYRFLPGRQSPTHYYVLAMSLVLARLGWHESRYWVAVAPFLMAYFVEGGLLLWNAATRRFQGRWKSSVPALAMAGWFLLLLAHAGDRLFRDNSPHGGLSYFASPTPEDFYLGSWGDLYRCCMEFKRIEATGPIVFPGEYERWPGYTSLQEYARHFTGRKVINYPPQEPPDFMLVPSYLEVPKTLREALNLNLLKETEFFRAYRVLPAPPPSPGAHE